MDERKPGGNVVPGWTYLVLTLTAAMLSVFLHVRTCVMLPNYDPADDTAYFQAESALQYRYARMLANGEEVPAVDARAQYPEGLKVGREISIWMEKATAFTSRALFDSPPRPYHVFVIFWACALSGLSVLACCLLGLALDGPLNALAAALLFGVCWIGSTLVTDAYGFQVFALPLMFFAVGAFGAALSGRFPVPGAWSAAGAAAFAVALVSWHFTRFFLISLWLALAWAAWRGRGDGAARLRVLTCAAWLLAFCAAAGLGTAVLRDTCFIASPAFLLGGALVGAMTLNGRRLAALLAALALAAAWQASTESAGFGHVYALLWDKLRFALSKPADPLKLSREARLLWTGPFNSPPIGFLVFSFLPLAFAAAPRVLRLFKGPAVKDPAGAFCDALLLIYAAGAILVRRLSPLPAFFLCVASLRKEHGRPGRALLAAGLAALAFFEGLKTVAPESPLNLVMPLAAALPSGKDQPDAPVASARAMLQWLRENGGGKPVAADFGVSAAVLAYTDSPVLLHPKFESAVMRNKTAEYLGALYSDEEALFGFCRKYGAGLLLYSAAGIIDESPEGARYMAGVRELKESMAAVRLHFFPEKLKHFRLLYENGDFRVFEAGKPGKAPASRGAIYDLALYKPSRGEGGKFVIDAAGVLSRKSGSERKVLLAWLLLRLGRPEKALAAYEEAFALWPPDENLKKDADRLRAALSPAEPGNPRPGTR